jgi:hypothetical protein
MDGSGMSDALSALGDTSHNYQPPAASLYGKDLSPSTVPRKVASNVSLGELRVSIGPADQVCYPFAFQL